MPNPAISGMLKTAAEYLQARRFAEAEGMCRQILSVQADHPEALNLLAIVARQCGNMDGAIAVMRRAVAAHPQIAEFHANLGEFSRQVGKLDESIVSFKRAIQIRPDEPTFHNSLGVALGEAHQYDEAIAELSRAIKLKPDYAEAYNSMGVVLRDMGRMDESLGAFQRAVRLQPNMPQAQHNMGLTLGEMRHFPEAAAAYSKAIELKPDYAMAHWNLGMLCLLLGDFQRGWVEYEWRLRGPRAFSAGGFSQPRWDGGDLNGRTIFLHTEQGFGDLIQFIRYVPLIAAKGGRIIVGCHRELEALLRGVDHVERVVPIEETPPPFDVYCPIMSLPLAFGTMPGTIPADVPFLGAESGLCKSWSEKLGPSGGKFRVGLAWAGRPEHKDDRRRSVRLEQLGALAEVEEVEFYSLQKGSAGGQAANAGGEMKLIDRTGELANFADSAAMIDNLDLVICVDTAVAHLAGALGKPIWVLLHVLPDWRWMLDREDSPWYPTMRLFRQKSGGDWDDVVRRVVEELRKEIQNKKLR